MYECMRVCYDDVNVVGDCVVVINDEQLLILAMAWNRQLWAVGEFATEVRVGKL